MRIRQKEKKDMDFDVLRALRKEPGIKIRPYGTTPERFFFEIDDSIDKKRLQELHIEKVALAEDYERYILTPLSVYEALGNMERTEQKALEDEQGTLCLTGDVAYAIPIADNNILLELTDTPEGHDRLRCVVPKISIASQKIHANQRVKVWGTLDYYRNYAQVQLKVHKINLLSEATHLMTYELVERTKLSDLPKKEPVYIKGVIQDWQKIAILCHDDAVLDNFLSIVTPKEEEKTETKLHFIPVREKFQGPELAKCIQSFNLADSYDAICILQGYVRDRYAYYALNDASLAQSIYNSHIPVLTGIGNAKGYKPLCTKYADYNAKTAQTLAYNLIGWKMKSEYDKASRKTKQTSLVKEDQQADFFHKLFHFFSS